MPDELRRGEPTAVPSSVELPEGRQLAVTWSIPDRFGGMTSAMLHRSRAFVRLAGRDVDVVTFDTRPDYASVRERLAAAGEIVPGIRLHNLY
jgi:poly(glycerol-phosphate) alpha-glucosyltransferase